ncbi:MAG TPA: hypothetical protein VGJ99_04855 [Actinomycetota bacterium]
MNDLERDLREVLDEDARRAATPVSAPKGLRRSVRRRQAVFVGLMGLACAAVVAGIVAGATTLLSLQSGPNPAAQGPTTTGTLNGITITYPQAWSLIDPDEAGLNGSSMMAEVQLPRIILALAPTDPGKTFGCPGLAGGAATFLMTVQEEPLALDGPSSGPWPVDLGAMTVDASESACYPNWDFLRAAWTAEGRTFEARVGFAPEASDEEHDAMAAAFASMTFEPSTDGVTSVALAHGTAGGEDWQLFASRDTGGLSLDISGETTGAGTAGLGTSSTNIQASTILFGSGSDAELVVFGAVPEGAVRVDASSADGSVTSTDVLDVPNEIDPGLNAFVLVVAPGPLKLLGYDASGEIVAHGAVDAAEPAPFPGASLKDGRHFGYVRSVDADARTIEFDLAYFLSGEEADRAYQEATGDTGPVPNDHFVVNDNPMLRTLALAPDVRLRLLDWNHCCEMFFDGDLSLFAQAIEEQADVTDGDLIYRGQSSWWITIENGVVTEIEEQYSP